MNVINNGDNNYDEEGERDGLLSANNLDEEDRNGTYNSESRKKKIQQRQQQQQQPFSEKWNTASLSYDDDRTSFSCRVGFVIVLISMALGVWIWSTQQVRFYNNSTSSQWNELRIRDIKSWCLDKSSLRCHESCSNPLAATHRMNHKTWKEAYYGNVREALIASEMRHVDVVFYGDSIFEGWKGLKLGRVHPYKQENAKVFERYFVKSAPPRGEKRRRRTTTNSNTTTDDDENNTNSNSTAADNSTTTAITDDSTTAITDDSTTASNDDSTPASTDDSNSTTAITDDSDSDSTTAITDDSDSTTAFMDYSDSTTASTDDSDSTTDDDSDSSQYIDPKFRALALGISGDKTHNLLWRIQNNEMPDKLNPSVWWILIGTNDFGPPDQPHCSPELVYMGIIRVVEEIRSRRSDAIIVINSILPRSEDDDEGNLLMNSKTNKKSVWQGILEVNRRLKLYCADSLNIHYYDATSLFLRQRPNTKGMDGQYIPDRLMADYVHPTAKGYTLYAESIVTELHYLMDASVDGRRPIINHDTRHHDYYHPKQNKDNATKDWLDDDVMLWPNNNDNEDARHHEYHHPKKNKAKSTPDWLDDDAMLWSNNND